MNGEQHTLTGTGNGPIDATIHALNSISAGLQVRSFEERAIGLNKGSDATACAFVEVNRTTGGKECYGVGMDNNIVTASIKALVSGLNRLAG
jgi:2-isopropylmalate synthase